MVARYIESQGGTVDAERRWQLFESCISSPGCRHSPTASSDRGRSRSR